PSVFLVPTSQTPLLGYAALRLVLPLTEVVDFLIRSCNFHLRRHCEPAWTGQRISGIASESLCPARKNRARRYGPSPGASRRPLPRGRGVPERTRRKSTASDRERFQ